MEFANVFSRNADLAGVARVLRELHPSVAIEGPDHDWRSATLTFGRLWSKRRLVFTYDPEYHAEPNWSAQMSGMSGYLERFPESGRKQVAVMLPTTFRFSLAARLEPAIGGGGDPRFDVITAVARHLDGVLFTPSALLDASGRVLFGAGGAAGEDPRAAWPSVVASIPISVSADAGLDGGEEYEEELDPPSAERVARRALVLAAMVQRAMLDATADEPGTAGEYRALLAWVREIGIEDELEGPVPLRPERHFERGDLTAPLGGMDIQAHIDCIWRGEGLAVLAWALGLRDLPAHDEPVDVAATWAALGHRDTGKARALLANPVLRPREEIAAVRNRLFALHWRLRDHSLRPRRMNFAEFARTAWFGPLDITGLPLAGGDLAIRGMPLDEVDPPLVQAVTSATTERHLAVNWLHEGPERYSDADVST